MQILTKESRDNLTKGSKGRNFTTSYLCYTALFSSKTSFVKTCFYLVFVFYRGMCYRETASFFLNFTGIKRLLGMSNLID